MNSDRLGRSIGRIFRAAGDVLMTVTKRRRRTRTCLIAITAAVAACDRAEEAPPAESAAAPAPVAEPAPPPAQPSERPWLNASLAPDERARLAVAAMTLDEKIGLLHGPMATPVEVNPTIGVELPEEAIPGAGFIPGVPRLGIPALLETDAGIGVTNPAGRLRPGDGATALPSGLAVAATWDAEIARAGGAMIGAEARAKGFNVMLAGPANQIREPRNGRNFEYPGEDPLLGGVIAGNQIAGVQSNDIVSTAKHFAFNAQETGRHVVSANLSEADMRESELLLYEVALEIGQPGAVMCAYNRVNGDYACENDFLLNQVLKGDWGYQGWVMSDWGAVHSAAKAALAGLDQQSGEQLDPEVFFAEPLMDAVEAGEVPMSRIDDMATRILRSFFASGAVDNPPIRTDIDQEAGHEISRRAAEDAIVLLKNDGVLPLAPDADQSIVLIGGHADVGVMAGGGSSAVWPVGGPAAQEQLPGGLYGFGSAIWHPSSPLEAMRDIAPGARIEYVDGDDAQAAAEAAAEADIAIVFATQWMSEASDAPDLNLPMGQDALIAAVAAANENTLVVLETGGPVLMPWLQEVRGVLEAWYPGSAGGEAIARVLFGEVNPSGRLPITFPASLDQLPFPLLPGSDLPTTPDGPGGTQQQPMFDVAYPEGSDVGYRWYDRQGHTPLFAFGHGLSYAAFEYANVETAPADGAFSVSFDLTNTGDREGAEVAQLYVTTPGGTAHRLAGWQKVRLAPGETRRITIQADRRVLADYDEEADMWVMAPGIYEIEVSRSAAAPELTATAQLPGASWAP